MAKYSSVIEDQEDTVFMFVSDRKYDRKLWKTKEDIIFKDTGGHENTAEKHDAASLQTGGVPGEEQQR